MMYQFSKRTNSNDTSLTADVTVVSFVTPDTVVFPNGTSVLEEVISLEDVGLPEEIELLEEFVLDGCVTLEDVVLEVKVETFEAAVLSEEVPLTESVILPAVVLSVRTVPPINVDCAEGVETSGRVVPLAGVVISVLFDMCNVDNNDEPSVLVARKILVCSIEVSIGVMVVVSVVIYRYE